MIAHCTERALVPEGEQMWADIFAHFGVKLTPLSLGCCGMCGAYGHEAEHRQSSFGIFELSWKPAIMARSEGTQVLATGYSCRSQTKRILNRKLLHPCAWLASTLRSDQVT